MTFGQHSDRYAAIPHKNDLDLGSDLALRFAAAELPQQYSRVQDFFRHRGAYARFKELLAEMRLLDKWYQFEAESTERALRNWCQENSIEGIESNGEPAARDVVGCLSPPFMRGSAMPKGQLSELFKLPPDARAELAMALWESLSPEERESGVQPDARAGRGT